jgi:hypothetical protein
MRRKLIKRRKSIARQSFRCRMRARDCATRQARLRRKSLANVSILFYLIDF